MIITLSGKPGSGKSTVAQLLAKRLGYRYEDMGLKRRKLAEAKGMTLEELNIIGEKEDWTDKAVDEYQKELGEKEDRVVISGWMSFHFIPHSVKIFLDVNEVEGSRRIFTDSNAVRRTEAKKFSTQEEILGSLRERIANSSRRYKKYYGVDIYDLTQYDLVIDTTDIPAEKVVERITDYLQTVKS